MDASATVVLMDRIMTMNTTITEACNAITKLTEQVSGLAKKVNEQNEYIKTLEQTINQMKSSSEKKPKSSKSDGEKSKKPAFPTSTNWMKAHGSAIIAQLEVDSDLYRLCTKDIDVKKKPLHSKEWHNAAVDKLVKTIKADDACTEYKELYAKFKKQYDEAKAEVDTNKISNDIATTTSSSSAHLTSADIASLVGTFATN